MRSRVGSASRCMIPAFNLVSEIMFLMLCECECVCVSFCGVCCNACEWMCGWYSMSRHFAWSGLRV